MKRQEIQDKLNLPDDAFDDEYNALEVTSHYEFNRKGKFETDYRKRAIEKCINAKCNFASDSNTLHDLIKRLISVHDPITGEKMQVNSGGGNAWGNTITFKSASAEITLSFPHDGVYVKFTS